MPLRIAICKTIKKIHLPEMFKFNFNGDEDYSQVKICGRNTNQWYKSKEVRVPLNIIDVINEISRDQIIKLDYNCGISFSCLSAKEVINSLREKSDNETFFDVLTADKLHSDLLPGRYEGGLKTWECTRDLVVYFMKHITGESSSKLSEKTVLDLGCGSGILGIMCLLQGAFVTFQDYQLIAQKSVNFCEVQSLNKCTGVLTYRNALALHNQEVLEAMTIPNIFLNCQDSVRDKIKLYSGDWSSFLHLMTDTKTQDCSDFKFDYILTSETIYNPENYKKIIEIIRRLLNPGGCAFVAAKRHYFGVGGNLKEFESLVEQEGLQCSTCWESTEGVLRGILEIKVE